jgi:HD-GYP domain-containing protein (c-di-GMP phosphodiesterase class II)
MVRYALGDVTDGMVLGQSIFNPNGELLLAAGFHINEQHRKRLDELGYHSVLIEVEGTEGVIPETIISEHVQREMDVTMNKSVSELNTVFTYRKITNTTVREVIKQHKPSLERFLAPPGLARALEKLIDEIMNQSAIVLNLSALDKANREYFAHVINVTIVALCIGRKYRLDTEELKQLGMGALNYDVGLIALPKDLLEKKEPLTDDEMTALQQHTVFGHLMLSENPSIPPTSSAVALQHHEHQDGSGFPRAIKSSNRPPVKDFSRPNTIHRFAEIVAVADAYDMLVSGRPHYSQKRSLMEAMKQIVAWAGTRLNSEVVKMLLTMVPLYPVGARVRVLNAPVSQLIGYSGVVAKDNPAKLDEPQVVLFETKHHQKVNPVMVDLAVHKGILLELIT